jgi:hypothetical protein
MTPGTLQQRHFDYVLGPNQDARLASVAAGATVTDINLKLDTDAPFLLRGRAVRQAYNTFNLMQDTLPFLKMRWTGPQKDYRQQAYVPVAAEMAYFGQVGNFKPEFQNIHYPAGGVLTVDLQNMGANPITNLMMFFRGVKLYPWGAVPAYKYPPKFAGLPFNYQIAVEGLDVTEYRPDQVFTVKQDADFVLRGGQATAPFINQAGTVVFAEVFMQLMDFNKKPYSNDFVPLDVLFGAGGFPTVYPVGAPGNLVDVTPFGTGPGSPGLFYPEIYVPANHQLIYALQRNDTTSPPGGGSNAPVSFTINLIGQKVFAQ